MIFRTAPGTLLLWMVSGEMTALELGHSESKISLYREYLILFIILSDLPRVLPSGFDALWCGFELQGTETETDLLLNEEF